MKKIFILLVFLISFGNIGFATWAEYDFDVKNNIVYKLSILDKEELDRVAVRSDLAVTLSNLTVFTEVSENLFTDVDINTEIGKKINSACRTGIMSGIGGGRFSPDTPVTIEHISKVMVCILGGKEIAEINGGYPTGYMLTAEKLNLFKNVNRINIKMSDLAGIISNLLETEITTQTYSLENPEYSMKSGIKYLKDRFNIDTLTTRLYTQKSLNQGNSNNIFINNKFYENKDYVLPFLGKTVKLYINHEDETVIAIEALQYDTVSILKDDITYINENQIEYEVSDDKTSKKTIGSERIIILNGIVVSESIDSLIPTLIDGYVDITNDRNVTVINIYSYEYMVVKSVDAENLIIFDYNDNGKYLDLNDYDTADIKILLNNSEVNFGDLEALQVLMVMIAPNRESVIINICGETKSGMIEEIEDENVFISGEYYKVSKYINLDDLRLGYEGEFCFDDRNRLIAIVKTDMINQGCGYLIDAASPKSLDSNVLIKFMGSDGKIYIKELKSGLKLNGEKIKNPELMTGTPLHTAFTTQILNINGILSQLTRNFIVRQPIIYKIDDTDKISEIDTYIVNPAEDENSLNLQVAVTTDALGYRSDSRQFGNSFGIEPSKTIIINSVRTENESDEFGNLAAGVRDFEPEKYYHLLYASDFLTNTDYGYLSAYNLSDGGVARVVVYGEEYSNVSGSVKPNQGADIAIVRKIADSINSDGEPCKKLYLNINGKDVEFNAAEASIVSNLKKGDIIQIKLDANGDIVSIYHRFSMSDKKHIENSTGFTDTYRGDFGTVYSKDASGIRLEIANTLGDKSLKTYMLKMAVILIYDEVNNTVKTGNFYDIIDSKTNSVYASQAYIRSKYGDPLTVIVLK